MLGPLEVCAVLCQAIGRLRGDHVSQLHTHVVRDGWCQAIVCSKDRHAALDGQLQWLLARWEEAYLVYEGVDAVSSLLLHCAVADIPTALDVCMGVELVTRQSASNRQAVRAMRGLQWGRRSSFFNFFFFNQGRPQLSRTSDPGCLGRQASGIVWDA